MGKKKDPHARLLPMLTASQQCYTALEQMRAEVQRLIGILDGVDWHGPVDDVDLRMAMLAGHARHVSRTAETIVSSMNAIAPHIDRRVTRGKAE